ATGRPLGKPLAHGGRLVAVAFDPDGRVVATAAEGDVRRWDAAAGRPLGGPISFGGPTPLAAVALADRGRSGLTLHADPAPRPGRGGGPAARPRGGRDGGGVPPRRPRDRDGRRRRPGPDLGRRRRPCDGLAGRVPRRGQGGRVRPRWPDGPDGRARPAGQRGPV